MRVQHGSLPVRCTECLLLSFSTIAWSRVTMKVVFVQSLVIAALRSSQYYAILAEKLRSSSGLFMSSGVLTQNKRVGSESAGQ